MKIDMRRYQIDAVNAAISYLKENQGNPLIVAATGTGKSIIIASLIERVKKANPDVKVIVCTHVAELVEQNAKKLHAIMPDADIGIYSAGLGQKQRGHDITFAGIQSIFRQSPLCHLLIIDEAHTISRNSETMWGSFISSLKAINPRLKVIGLTATDFRLDSGSLTHGEGALFDAVCFEYGLGRAIQDGYLCKLSTKSTETTYDVSGVGRLGGEFKLKELEAATNIDALTVKAVDEMIRKASNRKSWLIFCNGVKHSFAVRDELRRRGIMTETVTGETPDYERNRILEEFKSGTIRAVTNNAVWTTGVDVPNVDMIGMLRHTMSAGLLLQMAGRGTRTVIDLSLYQTAKDRRDAIAESYKPDCLFLDFAGNIRRHGFLDQIKAKEKKEKGDGVAPMKDCPECFSILHAAAKKCDDCGYEFLVNQEQKIEKLYSGDVLGGAPETRLVKSIMYMPHNVNKDGKTPCLRVKYIHDDMSSTSEYICLWHNGFAKQKALKWWKDRGGDMRPIDVLDVENLIEQGFCNDLKLPSKITIKKEGKYDRITNYDFSEAVAIEDSADFDASLITV